MSLQSVPPALTNRHLTGHLFASGHLSSLAESNCQEPEWVSLEALEEGSQATCGIVGNSPEARSVVASISRLAPHQVGVLIQGESGTGKELVARALHTMSTRGAGPLVTFNCSNL